jgi:hypothetical protein
MKSFWLLSIFVFLNLWSCEESTSPKEDANQPPIIHSTPDSIATQSLFYHYFVRVTDPDKDTLSLTLTDSPDWLSLEDSVIHGYPESSGQFPVSFTVTDGKNVVSQSYTLYVDENLPPIVNGLQENV